MAQLQFTVIHGSIALRDGYRDDYMVTRCHGSVAFGTHDDQLLSCHQHVSCCIL